MNFALENIHFVCTSSKVSSLDMAVPIANELQMLQEGIVMWDAKLGQNVLVIAPLFALLADNPRASELVNHLTGNPNLICRMCKVQVIYMCTCTYVCVCTCTYTCKYYTSMKYTNVLYFIVLAYSFW